MHFNMASKKTHVQTKWSRSNEKTVKKKDKMLYNCISTTEIKTNNSTRS